MFCCESTCSVDKVLFLAFDNINKAILLNDVEKKVNFTIRSMEFIQSLKDISEELRKELYNMEPGNEGKYGTL